MQITKTSLKSEPTVTNIDHRRLSEKRVPQMGPHKKAQSQIGIEICRLVDISHVLLPN